MLANHVSWKSRSLVLELRSLAHSKAVKWRRGALREPFLLRALYQQHVSKIEAATDQIAVA